MKIDRRAGSAAPPDENVVATRLRLRMGLETSIANGPYFLVLLQISWHLL